jgi:hypothetical protein
LGTIPHAFTWTRTSVEPGFGTGIVSIDMGCPTACILAARIIFCIERLLPVHSEHTRIFDKSKIFENLALPHFLWKYGRKLKSGSPPRSIGGKQ